MADRHVTIARALNQSTLLFLAMALFQGGVNAVFWRSPGFAIWSHAWMIGGLLIAMHLRHHIRKTLSASLQEARIIADGDLSKPSLSSRGIGFHELNQVFDQVAERMFSVVLQVRSRTTALATTSGMMSTDNRALADRTESQATSLEESAAALEQLTANVQETAASLQQVNSLVASANESAQTGGVVVAEVVAMMSAIQTSSQRIAEIINVIDGIAFQTNILALNAAVEAARAGEEGRGFAVVASEVRALAQRSAMAAQEIKALISDSVEKVEAGNLLAAKTGSAMSNIVSRVTNIASLLEEISRASTQQSVGILDVNRAINHIDGMTQENSRLVEEAAKVSAGLQSQAQNLASVVSGYTLGEREFGNADEAMKMVHAALEYARLHGLDKTLGEINDDEGRFVDRDLFVVAYSMKGEIIAHGNNPRWIGVDCRDLKSTDGKYFFRNMLAELRDKKLAWTEYKWVHPLSGKTVTKAAYLGAFNADVFFICAYYRRES